MAPFPQVGPVAGVGLLGPVDYHAQFVSVGRLNESINPTVKLLLVVADGSQFNESLATDVVRPPLLGRKMRTTGRDGV
ncbi:hypothetical protein CM1200mP19_1790 [bacterium]|nr:MAG: hypothetical protein CM1200mP19_1790 [bacterium]